MAGIEYTDRLQFTPYTIFTILTIIMCMGMRGPCKEIEEWWEGRTRGAGKRSHNGKLEKVTRGKGRIHEEEMGMEEKYGITEWEVKGEGKGK